MYILLDRYICWVGPMAEADARQLIAQEISALPVIAEANPPQRSKGAQEGTLSVAPTEMEIKHLLAVTGGFPALLKAACHWWLVTQKRSPLSEWTEILLADDTMRYRLKELWAGM